MTIDHPIFIQSIRLIRAELGDTGLEPLQQAVLERLIHTSGDFGLQSCLQFSSGACEIGLAALQRGAFILTDTLMAKSAVSPMACRTLKSKVHNVLDWAPQTVPLTTTRTAEGMAVAWKELSVHFENTQSPIVLIGSAPTALERLLDLIAKDQYVPSLIIGMPVGFVGVADSKKRLSLSGIPQIRLDGSRGGAALAAATVNTLLREAMRIKK